MEIDFNDVCNCNAIYGKLGYFLIFNYIICICKIGVKILFSHGVYSISANDINSTYTYGKGFY